MRNERREVWTMSDGIHSVNDVEQFSKALISEGVSFHPDDDFNDYVVNRTRKPCYSEQEAQERNALMEQCFDVCALNDVDIYNVMLEIALQESGMDAIIPLPSEIIKN